MSNSVLFFKSPSCPICKMVDPVFNEVAGKFEGTVDAEKIDITEDIQKAIDNGVMAVPTIIFLKDGSEVERFTGMVSKSNLEQAFGI
ncbi:thioredoxin family protein [Candidatus Latescibacterota bacterium]